MASGYSRRFQGNKLLYELEGMPLIAHTLQKLASLKQDKLIVVTQYDEIAKLAISYGAVVIANPYADEGQSASIRLGIAHSTGDQALLCVADQPYLKLSTLQKLLKRSDGEHIICTSCNGSYRNPAIFPRKYYRELLELQGEQGGKQLLKKYTETVLSVECDSHQLRDIDQKTDIYNK